MAFRIELALRRQEDAIDAAPSFVKQYAPLGALASQAARAFADEVAHRKFPGDEHGYR